MSKGFKPRPRDLVIGGLPWIARMSDKARAKSERKIDDYIYPCPIDHRVLGELGISPEEFMDIATTSTTDSDLIERVRLARDTTG